MGRSDIRGSIVWLTSLSVALVAGCDAGESSGGGGAGSPASGGSRAVGGAGAQAGASVGGASAGAPSTGGSSGSTSAGMGGVSNPAGSGGSSPLPAGSGGAAAGTPATMAGSSGQTSGGTTSAGASGASAGGSSTSGAPSGGAGQAGSGSSGPLKVMAIGDSITRATCWRAKLWETLNQSHAGEFDFVGTLKSNNGCQPGTHDQDNQGYGSSLITEIAAGTTNARMCDPSCPTLNDLATAFNAHAPHVALVHFGTNDVWNGKSAADILAGYSQVVDKLRAANPTVKVFVARIIPMNVTNATCSGCSCTACTTAVPELNTAIAAWAPSKSTAESPVTVVDQYTGFDATTDTGDGVHPNDAGSQKIAAKWAAALEPLF